MTRERSDKLTPDNVSHINRKIQNASSVNITEKKSGIINIELFVVYAKEFEHLSAFMRS